MIGYLHGHTIKRLIEAGVTQAWYSTSQTPGYYGDLVSVYFFDRLGTERAHQTQLAGQFGNPEVEMLTRSWGEVILDRGYERSFRWDAFVAEGAELVDGYLYRVV